MNRILSDTGEKVSAGYVVGGDISPDMIHYASSFFPASEYKNLSFVHADSLMLPFQNVFDVIFSNSTFHWISDHQTLFARIYQVLHPKGRLLIQMGGTGVFAHPNLTKAAHSILTSPKA